jgi:leucine-rich repeat protein SHOC2
MKNKQARSRVTLSQWLTQQEISWDGELADLQELDINADITQQSPELLAQIANSQIVESDFKKYQTIGFAIRVLSTKISNLTKIPVSIGKLIHLQRLNVNYTKISSLPKSIGQLTNLQQLDLSNNQLTSLPESIGQLIKLQKLDLSGNQLTSLPESIGQLTNLQKLDLSDNQLTSLPESIGQLTNLQEINLTGNRLTSLPESIGQLANLQALDLSWHQLTNLPESIFQGKGSANSRLTKLKKLDFLNNQLTNLPESIGELTSLQELTLTGNRLTSLPESIGQLIGLKELRLMDNQLTSLPESIGRLTNLQELWLDDNQLMSLPDTIGRLTNLKSIDLDGNPLTDLSALTQEDLEVRFLGVDLPRRYRTKFSDWQPEWLLDEDNAEIRRALVQQLGYEKVCAGVGAEPIDTWREYTLLEIERIDPVYEGLEEPIDWEPLVMLKMTCPSTGHLHILRVPPEMESAEAAITWVNHGIHPDDFAVQT